MNHFDKFKERMSTISSKITNFKHPINIGSCEIWYAYWIIIGGDYDIREGTVYFLSDGYEIMSMRKELVDFFVYHWYENSPDVAYQLSLDPFCDIAVSHSFEQYKPKEVPPYEKGQLKLFSNALEVVDRNKVNLIVIGSGGSPYTRSGQSYVHLASLVTGSIVCYDSWEIDQVINVGSTTLTYKGGFFEYTGDPDYSVTHVIDDSYTPTVINQKDDKRIGTIVDSIPHHYNGSFVVKARGHKEIELFPCYEHKDVSSGDVLGGGFIFDMGGLLRVYGASTHWGPYNAPVLRRLLPPDKYIVEDATEFNVDGKITALQSLFPNAIISTKCFPSTKVPRNCVMKVQRFYAGAETRIYFGTNFLPDGLDSHCDLCNMIQGASDRLQCSKDSLFNIIHSISGYSCRPRPMVRKKHIRGMILALARVWMEYDSVISIVSERMHITPSLVHEFITAMESRKTLELRVVDYCTRVTLKTSKIVPSIPVPHRVNKKFMASMEYIARIYGCSSIVGQCSKRVCGDNDRLMHVTDSYVPSAPVVVLRPLSIAIAVQYERTHDSFRHGFETVFVLKGLYPEANYSFKWDFLKRSNDPISNLLSTVEHSMFPVVDVIDNITYLQWDNIILKYSFREKIFHQKFMDESVWHDFVTSARLIDEFIRVKFPVPQE